ncbi:hypothetical protein C1645_821437, partial [Glomus cerebriforme]
IDKLNSKIASLEAQLVQPIQAQPQNNDALEKMYIRAVRLGMLVDAPKDLTSLDNYINDELIRRSGVANTNYTKLSKKYSQMVNVVKKLIQHKCSKCGKAGHNSRKKKVKKESSNPSPPLKKKSKSHLTAKSQENSASRILVNSRDDPTSNTPKTPDSDGEDEILNEPMEINFVQKKDPATDVVTTKCKIKHLVIPGAIVDPVVKYPKPMLILPNTLLDKYNYDLLASKRELRLECN